MIAHEPPPGLRQPELVEQPGELDLALHTPKRGRVRHRDRHTRQQRRGGGEQPRLLVRRQHHVDQTLGNHALDELQIANRIDAGAVGTDGPCASTG